MDKIFQGLPLELVLWANLFISIVGFIFIYGAPVQTQQKKFKLFFSLFWISLVVYYIARISISVIDQADSARLSAFLNPYGDFSITPSHWAWMLLVVLADISVLMLCFSHIYHKSEKIKKPWVAMSIAGIIFVVVWAIDLTVGNNALSNIIAFAVYFYTAWSCRINHISSSIIWIIYAFLHTPIGLATTTPFEWRHSIFVVLFATKLSLIAAMYNMLEVKRSGNMAGTA